MDEILVVAGVALAKWLFGSNKNKAAAPAGAAPRRAVSAGSAPSAGDAFAAIAADCNRKLVSASPVQRAVLQHELRCLEVERASLQRISAGTVPATALLVLRSEDGNNDARLLGALTELYQQEAS